MSSNWTENEVSEIISVYFHMLEMELSGISFNKAAINRQLVARLSSRSKGSIEFKHQNISAILNKFGMPYIIGYKPRKNYQRLLEDSVLDYVADHPKLDEAFEKFSLSLPLGSTAVPDFSKMVVDPPKPELVEDKPVHYGNRRIVKRNYLELEQRNRKLGELGEELVYRYEQWRLIESGKANLADNVEWVAKERGDGAGFDILSRNINGTDRYIEVKTTKLGEYTPVYLTRNELVFSQENASSFYLYRVFKYGSDPRVFTKRGAFDTTCRVEAVSFIGYVK